MIPTYDPVYLVVTGIAMLISISWAHR